MGNSVNERPVHREAGLGDAAGPTTERAARWRDVGAGLCVAGLLLAGDALMLLAVARQGQLSAFVSRPVLRGFAFALAITIVIKQLPDALGFALPHDEGSGLQAPFPHDLDQALRGYCLQLPG